MSSLPAGVENFSDGRVLKKAEKNIQADVWRQRVDDSFVAGAGNLYQAEFGVICFFAVKFQVDGDEFLFGQRGAEIIELSGCFYNFHFVCFILLVVKIFRSLTTVFALGNEIFQF